MPTYEYSCPKCGKFDAFQSISASPFESCPHCGSKDVRRLISANANIIFKGSGFYSTDNRKSDSKPSTSSTAAK